jgi:CDGSH-type Zn-finger protein
MEEKSENKSKTIVEVVDFGPLKITGNFQLKDLQRNIEASPGDIKLCRCGKSANKPHCDDSCKK